MPTSPSKRDMRAHPHQNRKVPPRHDEYNVGWICVLPIEMAVAKLMLDEIHPPLPMPPNDPNTYILGRVGDHNVVIACLPAGTYGSTTSVALERQVSSSFPAIRFYLSVGIGGGIPSSKADIRLGDVVVSQPIGKSGGLIRYDLGKVLSWDESSHQVPEFLSTALAALQVNHNLSGRMGGHVASYLSDMQEKLPPAAAEKFARPEEDFLFQPEYEHIGFDSCADCDRSKLILRRDREHEEPVIHYGSIASGPQVMKNGQLRDRIGQELGVLCFELEAAGLLDNLPCLAIRGISDYADSHKNTAWQGYAAAAAAAYAKELLLVVPALEKKIHTGKIFRINLKSVWNALLNSLYTCSILLRSCDVPVKPSKKHRCKWIQQSNPGMESTEGKYLQCTANRFRIRFYYPPEGSARRRIPYRICSRCSKHSVW